jgi:hypothetical protein
MSAVRDWLEEVGLGQYADAFEANDTDIELLTEVDDQLLKDISVSSAGHRLRLRKAIAKLAPKPIAEARAGSYRSVCDSRRAAPADSDVLRPRRLDGALGGARSTAVSGRGAKRSSTSNQVGGGEVEQPIPNVTHDLVKLDPQKPRPAPP